MTKGKRICVRTNPDLERKDTKDLRSRIKDTVESFNEEVAARDEQREDDE